MRKLFKLFKKLRLFEEQQQDGDSELIARINRHERVMQSSQFSRIKAG